MRVTVRPTDDSRTERAVPTKIVICAPVPGEVLRLPCRPRPRPVTVIGRAAWSAPVIPTKEYMLRKGTAGVVSLVLASGAGAASGIAPATAAPPVTPTAKAV